MRLLKQFLYGTFYLLIFGGLAWGLYSFEFKPAPSCSDNAQNGSETGVDCGGSCVTCEMKELRSLSVNSTILFGDNRVFSVVIELRNPNDKYGARDFSYTVNFYDNAGVLLQSVKNNSFIYAGKVRNILEAGVRISNGIPVRAETVIDQAGIKWESDKDIFRPDFQLKDASVNLDGEQAVGSGTITNPNSFAFSKVILSVFLVDDLGIKINASKTELADIGQFRVESFKIFIPGRKSSLKDIDLYATSQSIEVDVLK